MDFTTLHLLHTAMHGTQQPNNTKGFAGDEKALLPLYSQQAVLKSPRMYVQASCLHPLHASPSSTGAYHQARVSFRHHLPHCCFFRTAVRSSTTNRIPHFQRVTSATLPPSTN